MNLPPQEQIPLYGYALQCRITTEDPANNFVPDYGKHPHLPLARPASASGWTAARPTRGAVITPYYDSLLVKITAWGREFRQACQRMDRCLREFRIRGVKTNIPFLENVVNHPDFQAGQVDHRAGSTRRPRCSASRRAATAPPSCSRYLGDVIVNGNPDGGGQAAPAALADAAPCRAHDRRRAARRHAPAAATSWAREGFAAWTRDQKRLLLTDTTFRDAHQSLLATRVRTYDMLAHRQLRGAPAAPISSAWKCGAAPPSTSPCGSCTRIPGSACASCAKPSPTSASRCCCAPPTPSATRPIPTTWWREFIDEAAAQGIDIFRIFDSLNWLPNMKVADGGRAQDAARSARPPSATPATSSTRRATSTRSTITSAWPRSWSAWARTSSAIKDMAGLCKPYAAEKLVKALRQEVGIPIHFHTHDTSGINAASRAEGRRRGRATSPMRAIASMSGQTSQPNLNSIVAALAPHASATPGSTSTRSTSAPTTGKWCASYYAPFDTGPQVRHRRSLPPRDARRPVHQPQGAGRIHGPGRALARDRAHLCRRQPGLRRHRQGDAFEQGGGRHGDLPGQPQHDHGASSSG